MYQGIRIGGQSLLREAYRNVEIKVTDGDSWWDSGDKLRDIQFSGATFRKSEASAFYIFGASGGYIEPENIIITGCTFLDNNSDAVGSVGSAIQGQVGNATITGNTIGPPAGVSDYAVLLDVSHAGDDLTTAMAAVSQNTVDGTYAIEPIRIGASPINVSTLRADNLYPGPGRTLRQDYKLTTTDATTTTIWSYTIPSGLAGVVTAKILGSNADGSKSVSYVFDAGFRKNASTSSLSTGAGSWATTSGWNPDSIATAPTATLATDTLLVRVTGVVSETWTWICSVDMHASK